MPLLPTFLNNRQRDTSSAGPTPPPSTPSANGRSLTPEEWALVKKEGVNLVGIWIRYKDEGTPYVIKRWLQSMAGDVALYLIEQKFCSSNQMQNYVSNFVSPIVTNALLAEFHCT
jgi:hypothetical protein